MKMDFYKYHGTGNDFILIDNRKNSLSTDNFTAGLIEQLCSRRFGIGADGLMLLNNSTDYDFQMIYYNSDGNQSTMCGNGGRCIAAFAKQIGAVAAGATQTRFVAIDGEHKAIYKPSHKKNEMNIKLQMTDVDGLLENDAYYFLDTGSPHYVAFMRGVKDIDIEKNALKIRHDPQFGQGGTNVNFVEILSHDSLFVRTFERGVEAETYSCGTGSVAAALCFARKNNTKKQNKTAIQTKGGNLAVYFNEEKNNSFRDIWLEGPACFVFKGEVALQPNSYTIQ